MALLTGRCRLVFAILLIGRIEGDDSVMSKKIFVCLIVSILIFTVSGCGNHSTKSAQSSDGSTLASISSQPTENASMASTTQSADNSATVSSTAVSSDHAIVGESKASSTQTPSKTTSSGDDSKLNTECKLIVNGNDITNGNHIKINYEKRYAELPLTAVVTALGAKVEWQSKTTATISFGGKKYILDTTKNSLVEDGSTFNVLIVAPGSTHGSFFQVVGNEFVVDSDTAKLLLANNMGAKIKTDYDQAIVSIDNR